MSRWLSRTVPASARRAGRAVVMVSVLCLCLCRHDVPSFPRSNSSLSCPACPEEHEM